jgi:hypothetical protein
MFEMKRYLDTPGSISVSSAEKIYNEIQSHGNDDADFNELWEDLTKAAIVYVGARNHWNNLPIGEERVAMGKKRSSYHDSFMAILQALGRHCRNAYGDTWMDELGDSTDRKRLGDFAAYLLWFGALKGR